MAGKGINSDNKMQKGNGVVVEEEEEKAEKGKNMERGDAIMMDTEMVQGLESAMGKEMDLDNKMQKGNGMVRAEEEEGKETGKMQEEKGMVRCNGLVRKEMRGKVKERGYGVVREEEQDGAKEGRETGKMEAEDKMVKCVEIVVGRFVCFFNICIFVCV